MTNHEPKPTRAPAASTDETSKKYRDRPADEGKHGDAADEPNSGLPTSTEDSPGRPKSGSSRQQISQKQGTQTGSPELDRSPSAKRRNR
jgi:hypothetical protein